MPNGRDDYHDLLHDHNVHHHHGDDDSILVHNHDNKPTNDHEHYYFVGSKFHNVYYGPADHSH
jgi:hypothetical protein